MSRLSSFFHAVVNGYEPALARSLAVAVFTLLASFGLGGGNLPTWAEASLTFLAFVVPIAAGFAIRAKVTPVLDAPPADGLS